MQALIVYESMYGNTRQIAEAIAEGMRANGGSVALAHASVVLPDRLADADLVVVGGPTHAWSVSRPNTRRSAADAAQKGGHHVEPHATAAGLREWLAGLPDMHLSKSFAAFDTRRRAPLGLSGSAARALDRRLHRLGWHRAAPPQGFFVTKSDRLEPDELAHAQDWGAQLASA